MQFDFAGHGHLRVKKINDAAEGNYDLRIEMPAGFILDQRHGFLESHRGFVGACRDEGIKYIDDGEQPCSLRYLHPTQPIRIARAVEAFMVVANDRGGVHPRIAGDNVEAEEGMGFHDLELFFSQFSRFKQDVIRDADLAHVVKESAGNQVRNLLLWSVQFLG